jgi:hypothetical protein
MRPKPSAAPAREDDERVTAASEQAKVGEGQGARRGGQTGGEQVGLHMVDRGHRFAAGRREGLGPVHPHLRGRPARLVKEAPCPLGALSLRCRETARGSGRGLNGGRPPGRAPVPAHG